MPISRDTLEQLSHRNGHLLRIGLDPVERFCSRGTLDALGATWMAADFTLGGFEEDEHGINALSISLTDPDLKWAKRFKREFAVGLECAWYLLELGAQGVETSLEFQGELEGYRITQSFSVELDARVATGRTEQTPRVPHESPYSLARGEERVINGATYRVE